MSRAAGVLPGQAPVAFRVDASLQIGSGHVMRCLSLAGELRRRGVGAVFISRELDGDLRRHCRDVGFPVLTLAAPSAPYRPRQGDLRHASWLEATWESDAADTALALERVALRPARLAVDSYALDRRWETTLRDRVGAILAIDDLADRPHDCDLLLDQNLQEAMDARYDALLPAGCRRLLGPRYALLRPEFLEAGGERVPRRGIKRIHVFFGGSDLANETQKALLAIASLKRPDLEVDLVLGAANPHREAIESYCRGASNVVLHSGVRDMARLMAAADCAIGAGGSSTWERCCLGLPALVIALAQNQVPIATACHRAGACRYLGASAEVTVAQIAAALRELLQDPDAAAGMGDKGRELVDGKGTARVADRLLQPLCEDEP